MMDRRGILTSGIGLGAGLAASSAGPRKASAASHGSAPVINAIEFGLQPSVQSDQTPKLQAAIDKASAVSIPLFIPAGQYNVNQIELRPHTHLIGVPRLSVLRYAGSKTFFMSKNTEGLRFEGLVFDGDNKPYAPTEKNAALLSLTNVKGLELTNCRLTNSSHHGVAAQGCSGRIIDSDISNIKQTGIFSLDAGGLEICHNYVHDCGNNGIQVWRNEVGEDGTVITMNRIEKIKAQGGGKGQNGNGINLFRADSVIVANNRITDCLFSAIRANASSNCQILGNSCQRLGEVALYAEFGFEAALIANNLVNQAATGISITNFNEGGRLAVAQGNLIRNLSLRNGERGVGISVEADTIVTGNLVENADFAGLLLGWGKYLRDVTANNNIIRNSRIGIGISADPQAGYAAVTGNMITGSKNGAIRAMDYAKALGPDLSRQSAESYRNLAVFGNVGL